MKSWIYRLIEPTLLGTVTNILINIVFDPLNFDNWWSWSEFITAILFCGIITETNHFLEKQIEPHYSWTSNPKKRFLINPFLLTLIVVLVINVLGNLYMFVIDDSFNSWVAVVTINGITFFVALLLTIFKWTVHFYQKWKKTQAVLVESNQRYSALYSNIKKMEGSLVLKKNSKDSILGVKKIRVAMLEFGVLKVYTQDQGFHVFPGSISKLASILPMQFFFQVNRNMIVHRESILSFATSSHGKITVEVQGLQNKSMETSISRLKAASFRSWFHGSSSSTQ